MNKKTIETKACKKCWTKFDITNDDLEFYNKISPTFDWKKYSIPSPTLCPDCRRQRRLSYRIERPLYKRKCDFSGKPLISMYSPDKKDIVYEKDFWWSDEWNPLDYGQNFDFSKPFFEQFADFAIKVPKAHIEISPSENSIYTNQAGYNKNCYLTFEAWFNENSLYSNSVWNSTNVVDCSFSSNLQNCFDCIDVKTSFNMYSSQESSDCRDSYYLYDCHNCSNCIACWNLNGKQYYIFNEEVSKETYEDTLQKLQNDIEFKNELFSKYKSRKKKEAIHKSLNNISSENCSWNNITESENCSWFSITGSKNCHHCQDIYSSEDCMDYSYWGNHANHIYESMSIWNKASQTIFSYMCYENINNLIYCMNCINNCKNCFGSVWLKNKEYCIFNKQYTKEEYEKIVPQIIEHMKTTWEWGEFFPSSISPFGYNEVLANEYFPLEKEEAIKQGFNWEDNEYPVNVPEWMPRIEAKDLPALKDLNEDIEKKIITTAIICEISWKPYRILQQELDFYKKHNIPLPKKHQDIRHLERMSLRNPRKLYDRKCDKCEKEMKTTYSPDRTEKVYGKDCYEKEIY